MLWQIFPKFGGNLNIWEWDILSFPLVAICYIAYDRTDRYAYSDVELTINQVTYKYVPWYQVHLLSQCLQQSIKQFTKTQLSVTTAGYGEMRWISVSSKPSPVSVLLMSDVLPEAKCSFWVVADFCAFNWVCWRRLRWRRICHLLGRARLILSYWQNNKKNPANA